MDPRDRHHLAELAAAERHVARGQEIIDQVKTRRHRLTAMGASPSRESGKLLALLNDTQRLLESHLELVKRELGLRE
jgi:hypothetical protein